MRILILSVLLAISVMVTCGILLYQPGLDQTEIEGTEPVLIGNDGEKSLYRVDLNNGPLYYYQYPDGQVKVVAFATWNLRVHAI